MSLRHNFFSRIQDTARRQQEEFLLAKNGLEAKLMTATDRNAKLEAEKSAWKQRPQSNNNAAPALRSVQQQAAYQGEQLRRQASGPPRVPAAGP